MSRQTLVHRLRAMGGVATALVALAALVQLRPTWSSLPRSLASPLTVTEVEQIAELLLWLALVALALLLVVRSLRAAARRHNQTNPDSNGSYPSGHDLRTDRPIECRARSSIAPRPTAPPWRGRWSRRPLCVEADAAADDAGGAFDDQLGLRSTVGLVVDAVRVRELPAVACKQGACRLTELLKLFAPACVALLGGRATL